MEILDLGRATDAYDTYVGMLKIAGDAIKPHLEGKLPDADGEELLRLEAVLRKIFRESTTFSILLADELIEQVPLLAHYPAKNAELVKAKARFSIAVKQTVDILSKVDAAKAKRS